MAGRRRVNARHSTKTRGDGMTDELLRQMTDDVRAIRREVERMAERHSFRAVLLGLKARGAISQADIDRLDAAETAPESPVAGGRCEGCACGE